MKQLTFLQIIAFILLISGCESYIGNDINRDPNNPTGVPVFAQLPAIQITLADTYGGDFSRFNCALVQQVEGVARQYGSIFRYTGMTPNRFDAAWQNVYENILNEVKIAKATADEKSYQHYVGVLNVIEAFTLMMATDVWDDMPYTEALKGLENPNPAYDRQSDIYAAIFALLDEALSLFDGAGGALVPASEDVFYAGDIDLWKKAAHAIKARGLLKQKDYSGAASEAKKSFTNASENLGFQYPDANSAAQWYRFNRDRTGDIELAQAMKSLLTELNDNERLAVIDQAFTTAHTYLVADFFQELITYRELQFIIAEADLRATPGGTQEGHNAYLAGIKASFDKLGLSESAFDSYILQPLIDPGVGNLSLEDVLNQKYIALFLQPESYSDWRRTDIPSLTPISGLNIPVRWHYSSEEYLFNSSSPTEAQVNIFTDRVGWNR